ncbi:hypothetical protein Hdeb2414_s0009g00317571 [Helianthus debilis subsp. tardiflorus]
MTVFRFEQQMWWFGHRQPQTEGSSVSAFTRLHLLHLQDLTRSFDFSVQNVIVGGGGVRWWCSHRSGNAQQGRRVVMERTGGGGQQVVGDSDRRSLSRSGGSIWSDEFPMMLKMFKFRFCGSSFGLVSGSRFRCDQTGRLGSDESTRFSTVNPVNQLSGLTGQAGQLVNGQKWVRINTSGLAFRLDVSVRLTQSTRSTTSFGSSSFGSDSVRLTRSNRVNSVNLAKRRDAKDLEHCRMHASKSSLGNDITKS